MGGVFFFVKKVENGRCFFVKKSEKWGCYFVKKWTFPQRRVHYVQYQYFLFYILLIGGGRTPPAYGPGQTLQAGYYRPTEDVED